MNFWVGTSGFSYKEWKGTFYPEKLPDKDMLSYYSGKLPSVEINNTFYRMPKASMLENWAEQVPDGFRFVLKASRKISHQKRLKQAGEETEYLFKTAATLKKSLGAILFQFPPYFRKNMERLEKFLQLLPETSHSTFEFRHESWFDKELYDVLRKKNCALCLSDTAEQPVKKLVSTADWGYLRLRKMDYSDDELKVWVKKIKSQDWQSVYVYFKHEDEGAGPKMAARFLELAEK
jgi:uncharacterized protein YecE (DUF72 family)